MATRISLITGASLAIAAVLLTADARAQYYLGAEAGWTGLPYQADTIPGLFSVPVLFNAGFNAGFRGGYQWGPWRFEGEYSYRQNNVANNFGETGFSISGVSGNRHTNSIMTNVLYDFTVGWPITPHIGVGVGAVDVFDGLKVPGIGQLFNNTTWQFGYQAFAGLRYNLNTALALDLDYRYFTTIQPTFSIPNTSIHYRSGYNTNNMVASLTYRFGPPPAPPPMAAPAPPPPPQVFLVRRP